MTTFIKQRRDKRLAKSQEAAQAESEAIIARATKYHKRLGGWDLTQTSPARTVAILRAYIGGLDDLRASMTDDFSGLPGLASAVKRIDYEIGKALELIARAGIEELEP